MRVKWTTETFIQKLKSIFGDDFLYDFIEYTGTKNKVLVYCRKHGFFYKKAGDLLKGSGCELCYNEIRGDAKRDNFEDMVKKVNKKHSHKYIIPHQEYKNDKTKIKVICKTHGEFFITPNRLKNGNGCKYCSYDKLSKKFSDSTDIFKNKFIKKYGYEKYDLTKVDLEHKDKNGKIILVCHKKFKNGEEHGEFKITPNNALRNHGCPYCTNSIAENEIYSFLNEKNIKFIHKANKKDLNWIGEQHLDFYLPDYNVAIECQGIQHFEPVEQFGGKESFINQIKNDKIKRQKCKDNNVKLLYFSLLKNKIDNKIILDKNHLIESIING